MKTHTIFKIKVLYNLFLIVLISTMGLNLQAQDRIKEKVKSHKVAFISERLELSEEEAQKFWPIYNAYQGEMDVLKASQDIKLKPNLTDREADELMEKMLTLRTKEIEIQRKYIQKMKAAIPSRKIAMLFRLEREFQGKIISKIKERSQEKGRKY